MGENTFYSEALLEICSKAMPCVLKPDEIFRPTKAGQLYVCKYSSNIIYLYFTEYNKENIVGWIFDVADRTIGCPIIVARGAECWFNNNAGQRLIDSNKLIDNILVTDAPEHQRICIRPSDMVDAIKGKKLMLAS